MTERCPWILPVRPGYSVPCLRERHHPGVHRWDDGNGSSMEWGDDLAQRPGAERR